MALISLSYDEQDEDLGLRVAMKLRELGATVLTEPSADRERPAIERADGVAARAKAADLVGAIAASDAASMAEATRALRAAAAYNRRIVVARLDADTAIDDVARDSAARRGAAYGEDANLSAFRSVDLFRENARDDASGDEEEYDEERGEAFVDQLLRGAELGKKERDARGEADEGEADGFGFPRSPAAMLSRWRLIEAQGDLEELESFLADYADDPYFAIRAASAIRAARRRQGRQRGAIGYHVTMATMLAAGVIGFGSQACGPEGCSVTEGVQALWSRSELALQDEFAAVEDDDASGSDAAARTAALLRRSRERAAAETAKARKAETAAAAARGQIAELQTVISELREERDDIRDRYRSLSEESKKGAGAASADARGRAEKAESDLKKLESEQNRLRLTLAAARRERDRFEAAARERAQQLAELRRELDEREDASGKAAERGGEERRLSSELRVARADLRKRQAEVDRLTKALEQSSQENRTLQASLERSETLRERAEASAAEAARRSERLASADRGAISGGAAPVGDAKKPASRTIERKQAVAVRKKLSRPASARAPKGGAGLRRSGPTVGLKTVEARRDAKIVRRGAADPRAVRRVLSVMRNEMNRSAAGRSAQANGRRPYLTPRGVRLVQSCLRRGAGARIRSDGVWGRRTTAALLSVRGAQADRVSGCLRNRLRGR